MKPDMATIETKKISELRIGDNLSRVDGEVVDVGEQKPFGDGQTLQQTTIADETGATVRFTMFDREKDELSIGDKVRFHNCFIKEFSGSLTLNLKKTTDSKFEIISKGDGTTQIKTKPSGTSSTFNAVLGARQTAVQVAGRIHQGASASIEDLLAYAEKIEVWLNRP